MGFPLNDIGAFVKAYDGNASEGAADIPSIITAGAALDNVKSTGQGINRKNGTALAHSAVVATGWLASLADTKTLSLAHEVQYSSDNSSFDTAVVIEAATVKVTATAAAATYRGVSEHDLNLMAQKQYLRINTTLDLSAANTDIAIYFTIVMLGGWTQIPQ